MRDETPLRSLGARVSPPLSSSRSSKRRRIDKPNQVSRRTEDTASAAPFPSPAAVEAGQAEVRDHLQYFTTIFSRVALSLDGGPPHPAQYKLNGSSHALSDPPRLPIDKFKDLYLRNANKPSGHHFVVHQHDHPRAGTHYDLRLQINQDSSCSWAIPYGLPGNPWEQKHGRRQGIETRVHSLWNHLIEAASHKTGSMLIWDTGEYEVLPFNPPQRTPMTDDEASAAEADVTNKMLGPASRISEAEKLCAAFKTGKIRLRLHGTKLPPGYMFSVRLSESKNAKVFGAGNRFRRPRKKRMISASGRKRIDSPSDGQTSEPEPQIEVDMNSDAAEDAEDDAVRANNAYPGARNTVGSVHQRWWFVAMDKAGCGFTKSKGQDGRVVWTPNSDIARQRYPFFVQGREVERSIVTGRKATDVLEDEGVKGYASRGGWTPILA